MSLQKYPFFLLRRSLSNFDESSRNIPTVESVFNVDFCQIGPEAVNKTAINVSIYEKKIMLVCHDRKTAKAYEPPATLHTSKRSQTTRFYASLYFNIMHDS